MAFSSPDFSVGSDAREQACSQHTINIPQATHDVFNYPSQSLLRPEERSQSLNTANIPLPNPYSNSQHVLAFQPGYSLTQNRSSDLTEPSSWSAPYESTGSPSVFVDPPHHVAPIASVLGSCGATTPGTPFHDGSQLYECLLRSLAENL